MSRIDIVQDVAAAPVTAVDRPAAGGLPRWMLLGVPTLLAIACYLPLVPGLVKEWSEFPSLSHGFVVPFIAAYLVAVRWDSIRTSPIAPSFVWGVPVLVAGLASLIIGVRGDESFIARISLPVILLGLSFLLAGPRLTAHTATGIAYLLLMVPLPWTTLKTMTYRSRMFDADVSAWLLPWLGVPVLQDGVLLHLANMTLEVADQCSSIPAIAALVSLGAAYASLTRRSAWARVLIVVATMPIAIASNIVRITLTAAGVYHSGPWVLQSVFHHFAGSTNFVFTLLLILLLDAVLARTVKAWAR